jgi:general secretion pathway protein B
MSFILEALKKSERERQQGQPPDLFAVHGEAPAFQAPPGRHPRVLLWAGLCTLIVDLGGGYLWFGGGTTVDKKLESIAKNELAAPAKPPAAATRPAAEPAVAPAPAEKPIVLPAAESAAEPEGHFARESAAPPASAAPTKGRITIRPELPTLRFSGHTYSEERSRRMIMVNNRILREGDWIDGKIRLEEITWEGVILDHQGVQLKVKTQ